jgi:hypothetical protein
VNVFLMGTVLFCPELVAKIKLLAVKYKEFLFY